MRFQSIQNSKIYRLYRQDQMDRLTRKIEEIKQRKNQHISNSRQKHLLPYISLGYGLSLQRKRQIQKQNVRLQQKIKKARDNHSSYFLANNNLPKCKDKSKHPKQNYIQSLTNRQLENNLLPPYNIKSDRNYYRPILTQIKREENESQLNNDRNIEKSGFRKQIMKIYTQSLTDLKKKIL